MGAQCCSTVDNERASEVVRPPTLVTQHTAQMSSPPALDLSEVCTSDEARRHGPLESTATRLKRFPAHLNKKLAAVKNAGEEFEFSPDRDNEMVGKGIFLGLRQLESQAIYVGQWWERERNGRGLQIYPDGSVYEGYWLFGKRHGQGRFTDCSGDVYEGSWKEDAAEGEGKFVQVTGAVFHGTWKDNKQNGFGVEVWPTGERYEGNYLDGCKEGQGKLILAEDTYYVGEFRSDKIEGKGNCEFHSGEMHWEDGRYYIGDWTNNERNGTGEFRWVDGKRYIGSYQNNHKYGMGKVVFGTGEFVEGNFKNNKLVGTFFIKEGEITLFTGNQTFKARIQDGRIDRNYPVKQLKGSGEQTVPNDELPKILAKLDGLLESLPEEDDLYEYVEMDSVALKNGSGIKIH